MAETKEVLTKVQALVRLANDSSRDNEEEKRNAALTAAHLMKEHDLVLIPRSEIQRIEGAARELQSTMQKLEGEGMQKMVLAGLAGMFLGKKGIL